MNYHAHVYWQNEAERQISLELRPILTKLECGLGRIMEQPIGPHPLPSYQINYSTKEQVQIETLLAESGLNVLLHEDTGDDMRDHTEGARWLGNKLKLDLEWLKEYTRRSE
jgi:DOPA 4,5-dioxygenase